MDDNNNQQSIIDNVGISNEKVKRRRTRNKENSWNMSEMRTPDGEVSTLGWERLEQLTKIIIKKHFAKISIYSDLNQIGLVKSATVIKQDPENGNYKSLRTYLYTCIRNEISNYLYHTHKRTKESSESLAFCKTNFKSEEIDNKYIDLVFSKLSRRFRKYKKIISYIIMLLSDTENITDEDYNEFQYEFLRRKEEKGLILDSDDKITNHLTELLYQEEIYILILIVYEIKKDFIR